MRDTKGWIRSEDAKEHEVPRRKETIESKLMLTRMAWRNIWRNKRRSIITILAVTFAVMLSIALRGIQLGTCDVNIRHITDLFIGGVQIQAEGFRDNPPLRRSFRLDGSIDEVL